MNSKHKHPKIKLLDLGRQAVGMAGRYNPNKDEIYVGCSEKDVSKVLWHEFIHNHLFKTICLESAKMWDNIAFDIENHMFGSEGADPYAWIRKIEVPRIIMKHQTLQEKYALPENIIQKTIEHKLRVIRE